MIAIFCALFFAACGTLYDAVLATPTARAVICPKVPDLPYMCAADSSCPENLECNKDTRLCLPSSCKLDGDCASGMKCNGLIGACVSATCTSDSDCVGGQKCDRASGACGLPKCSSNVDCGSGERCAKDLGLCVARRCRSNGDCSGDTVCNTVFEACLPTKAVCSANSDKCAESGTVCNARINVCSVATCKITEDCTDLENSTCCSGVCFNERISGEQGNASCFSAQSTVKLENGAVVTMADLAIGDRVQVSPMEYSDVFTFTHRVRHAWNRFLNLETSASASIILTPGHYVFASGKLVAASQVKVGDYVELASGKLAAVTGISESWEKGLYNPQTIHGDIIVNGIRASTYTTAVQQTFAHALLSPLRLLYNTVGLTTASLDNGAKVLSQLAPRGSEVF